MGQLTQNSTQTVQTRPFEALTLTSSADVVGRVVHLATRPGRPRLETVALVPGTVQVLGPYLGTENFRIECDVGTVDYIADVPADASPAVFTRDASTGGPVPFARTAIAMATVSNGRARPVINLYGDSFQERGWFNWIAPVARNESTTLPGISVIGMQRKIGATVTNLTYNATNKSVTFGSGPETVLMDGVQLIPGATVKTGVLIRVRKVLLAATDGVLVCTPVAGVNELVLPNSIGFWLNTFAGQGYVLKNYGHSSGQLVDQPGIIDRSTACDGWALNIGTNDIVNGDSLSTIQGRFIVALDRLYAKARKGIVNAVTLQRTEYTTGMKEIAEQLNRWLPVILDNYPGVAFKNPWVRMSDATGVAAWTVMTSDGLHPDEPAAQLCGWDWFQHFDRVLPGTPWDFGAGNGVWSATNPNGNRLLNPNPVGNVSGVPTGWTFTATTATGSATSAKEARTDGVAGEWAVITGSASADQTPHYYTLDSATAGLFVTGSVPAPGELVQLFVEVKVTGALQMCPGPRAARLTGTTLNAYSRISFASVKPLQMTDWSGVIATPPFEFDSTDNAMRILLQQFLLNGASNAKTYFGRVWFGTPVEPTYNATL